MTTYEITYIRTGSGEKKETDKVWMNIGEEFEFDTGIEKPTSITEIIEVFEKIAAKWWGTYETRNAITNIKMIER